MKKISISTTLALLLLIVLASSSFAAPSKDGKEFQLKGSMQSLETYDINFPIMSVTASGSGNASHLGLFTVSYDVEVNVETIAGVGSAEFVAANGDSIFAEGTGQATPTDTPGVFNVVEQYTITGGTGRFVGARGNITLDRVVDTTTGITSGTVAGNITTP